MRHSKQSSLTPRATKLGFLLRIALLTAATSGIFTVAAGPAGNSQAIKYKTPAGTLPATLPGDPVFGRYSASKAGKITNDRRSRCRCSQAALHYFLIAIRKSQMI